MVSMISLLSFLAPDNNPRRGAGREGGERGDGGEGGERGEERGRGEWREGGDGEKGERGKGIRDEGEGEGGRCYGREVIG